MQRIILLLIIALGFRNISLSNQISVSQTRLNSTDTLSTLELVAFLETMNVQSYYGMPVDSFLATIPANFYNLKVYSSPASKYPNFKASYLRVDFTTSIYGPGVKIYVREFSHMNKHSSTASWDAALFRQENIYKIEVWSDQNTCINGSCRN